MLLTFPVCPVKTDNSLPDFSHKCTVPLASPVANMPLRTETDAPHLVAIALYPVAFLHAIYHLLQSFFNLILQLLFRPNFVPK